MKIDGYSIVYSGLDDRAYFAAATIDSRSVWAAASGNRETAALRLINSLEDLDNAAGAPSVPDVEEIFFRAHSDLLRMDTVVSAAGAFSDGSSLNLFNIGNARAIVFVDGYMVFHTDDHSEAYENDRDLMAGNAAAYDSVRGLNGRLVLTRGLGLPDSAPLQFYPPVPLQKNLAVLICTERFWRYLSVMEMELDYRKAAGPEEWLKIMTRRVLMKAGHELDDGNFAAAAVMAED